MNDGGAVRDDLVELFSWLGAAPHSDSTGRRTEGRDS